MNAWEIEIEKFHELILYMLEKNGYFTPRNGENSSFRLEFRARCDKFTVSNYGKMEWWKINDEINDAQGSVSHTCFPEASFQSIANFLFVILLYYSSKEIINKNKKLG